MKRWCRTCHEEEPCVIIAHDEKGEATVTVCHRCGTRII